MAEVRQTGDFSYATFQAAGPALAPVEAVAQGIQKLDQRHEQALDQLQNIEQVKLMNINAADEPYRRELLSDATSAVEAHVRDGNYAFALNQAKIQARRVANDEGLLNRVKTNEEYQTWRTGLLNRNDISSEKKEWLLSKNKYLYGESVTPEGDVVRKTWDEVKREIGRAEVREIPISDIVKSALGNLKPDAFGAESILFKRADGTYTKDMNEADPNNPLPYMKTGNSYSALTADKIRAASKAYINSNPEALASLRQEYDYHMDVNQGDLLGQDGMLMDFNTFIDAQIDPLSSSYAYRNNQSTLQPLDGLKYAAERRLARLSQQQQVEQVPISGKPINVNEDTAKRYNEQLEKQTNIKSQIVTKMSQLGLSELADEEFTSSNLNRILSGLSQTATGLTPQTLNNEIANIKRLSRDYFLLDNELTEAKQITYQQLTPTEINYKDFADSIVRGERINESNPVYQQVKQINDTFVKEGRKVILEPSLFNSASFKRALDDANISYSEGNRGIELDLNVENLFKYANSGLNNKFSINKVTTQPNSYTAVNPNNGGIDPLTAITEVAKVNHNINAKTAKTYETNVKKSNEAYAQNYISFELTSILRNSDQVDQLRDFTVNTLRNPDSRSAVRVYASDAKTGLSFSGDGLSQKDKNKVFDNLIINDKDAVIGIVPNVINGRDAIEITIKGSEETKTKDGRPNSTFYIAADDYFNSALSEVYSSPAYQMSAELARLDKIAHNRSVDLPSAITGFEDSRFRFTNAGGDRTLRDDFYDIEFKGREIDKVLSIGRQLDNLMLEYKRAGIDYSSLQGMQQIQNALRGSQDFRDLATLYSLAKYGNQDIANLDYFGEEILNSIYKKYK